MPLPFEPEIEEMMKARFNDALSPVYILKGVEQGGERPGQSRKHVFDYFDGTRLIISRDKVSTMGLIYM